MWTSQKHGLPETQPYVYNGSLSSRDVLTSLENMGSMSQCLRLSQTPPDKSQQTKASAKVLSQVPSKLLLTFRECLLDGGHWQLKLGALVCMQSEVYMSFLCTVCGLTLPKCTVRSCHGWRDSRDSGLRRRLGRGSAAALALHRNSQGTRGPNHTT